MPDPMSMHVKCRARLGVFTMDLDTAFTAPWTVLFGPSGSGKSSLLRCIAGLWRPPGSAVTLNGEDLTRTPVHQRRIGLVPQSPVLFPHMSVRGNLLFGSSATQTDADAILASFRLEGLADQPATALSGGQRQRLAIARALAAQPRLVLLDEVFTGMESTLRAEMIAILKAEQARTGFPILSVTHDISEAFATADEIVRIDAGTIHDRGTCSDVLSSERARLVAELQR